MKTPLFYCLLVFLSACAGEKSQEKAIIYDDALLQKLRAAANAIPGDAPLAIGYMKYAESKRKCSDVVEGATDDTCVMARTAFQVLYAGNWIMVDAGMDRDVHKFFEKAGPQPFDEANAAAVRKAVEGAKLIVITHEHGDHVAGVIRDAAMANIPPKTILTRQQADALMNNPQMPGIALTEEASRQYLIVDFDDILPVAPGMVLIKAPGHTKGEIMIYTRLQNGKEFLFTGDITWSYKGIAEKKQKPASERKRVGEDTDMIEKQLAWINVLMTRERMTVLVSHDNIMLPQYATQGLIYNVFK